MKSISDLLEKIKTDPEFASKYTALDSSEAFIKQAQNDGYVMNEDEVKDFTARAGRIKEDVAAGMLSENDLEMVAGGGSYCNTQGRNCKFMNPDIIDCGLCLIGLK